MNKSILLALVATAFAQNECATTEELKKEVGKTEYYLRYYRKDGANKNKAFTTDKPDTGKYIGLDHAASENSKSIKIVTKNEPKHAFTIKQHKTGGGFEVFLKEANTDHVLSWNQGNVKKGYYMYRKSSALRDVKYTRFIFDDATNALSAKPEKNEYVLGVKEQDPATEIYRQKNFEYMRTSKLEFLFCFQKVDFFTKSNTNTTDNEEPHKDELTDNKQCKVDELTDELKKLDAEFKDQSTCQPGKSIESTETCKAFCKPGYAKVSPTTYTCSNGTWEKPEAIVCKPIKLATCKVDAALEKLKGLDAEFKEEKCQEGKEIEEKGTCEASCKDGFEGDKVQYPCNNKGEFTPEVEISCRKSGVGQFGVFVALLCLSALY